ncbi:kinase-like protein [Rhizopus microsporus ATCC 52813]|uniref:non-specific serine/threonine protein kinase n=1 Tax=Rhizopus microsporus ATCC 52813 TaxID=1340429 RepID=A0A2G4SY37_RHIZD|nr:kinase-like protein [Rhizopus microsporus ATCC 52813]PHZ13682.1 kinase-like protein [Rhizopus microsporus ATCC 52813]
MECKQVIIKHKWLILYKIGEGSFGQVFKAKDIKSNDFYAIKRELKDSPQLYHEFKFYKTLKGGPCIPNCYWFGQHDGFNCLTLDLLGPSLKHLQEKLKEIPLRIVVQIGCQLIACFKHMHDLGIVYRDIKPENFLFPYKYSFSSFSSSLSSSTSPPSPPSSLALSVPPLPLYIVDFGLATWWRNSRTNKPYPEAKYIKYKTGTARYASIRVHKGHSHARRDDLESLGYMLLDLLCGDLPWSGVVARSRKAGWDRIRKIKEDTSLFDLCIGLPVGILHFIDYTRKLEFYDTPDYDYLISVLQESLPFGSYSTLVKPQTQDLFDLPSFSKSIQI